MISLRNRLKRLLLLGYRGFLVFVNITVNTAHTKEDIRTVTNHNPQRLLIVRFTFDLSN
jgi:hypothetical protein